MYKAISRPWTWHVDQLGRRFCSHGSLLCWSKLGRGAEALIYVCMQYMFQNKNCHPSAVLVLLSENIFNYVSLGAFLGCPLGAFLNPSHPSEFPCDNPVSNKSLPRCSLIHWGCGVLLDISSHFFFLSFCFCFIILVVCCLCINSVCFHMLLMYSWPCQEIYIFGKMENSSWFQIKTLYQSAVLYQQVSSVFRNFIRQQKKKLHLQFSGKKNTVYAIEG